MAEGVAKADGLVPVRRHLENVRIDGQFVHVTGWVFATDGRRIRDVGVHSFPRGLVLREVRQGASLDVAARHAGHASASSCRFHMVLAGLDNGPDGALVQLQLTFDNGSVRTWHFGVGLKSPPTVQVEQVGGGHDVGSEFLDYFVDCGGLTDTESVLDFGCGTGRMAIPLARFLGPKSTYLGVDVDGALIEWCKANVGAQDPRFVFAHSNVKNAMYNAGGSDDAPRAIPAVAASASFAFATSVFTHLRADHVKSYLAELGRVLRPGGRVLLTAFLVDGAVHRDTTRSTLQFVPFDSWSWTAKPSLPEFALGYRLPTLLDWSRSARLEMRRLLPGSWSGGDDGYSFQDILVLNRT